MAVRLHVILARASERAVVFRRGPSKRVRLLLWHTKDDAIEPGQWLHGRVYEHRCDLSPQGELLVYFAAAFLPRNGWTLEGRGRSRIAAPEGPVWIEVTPPEIWSRHHPRDPELKLRRILTGIKVLDGPWYRFAFDVGHDDRDRQTLEHADWADFAHDGDLVYAARGCLYRVPWRKKHLVHAETRCVADLRDDTFARMPAPDWAARWP